MRRLYAACGILLLLLALSLANGWYARGLTARAMAELEHARELAAAEQWERAETITGDTLRRWRDNSLYLHIVMRHEDTDQILRTFRQVEQFLSERDLDQYAAANADLIVQMELLSDKEAATLDNVL